MRLTDAAILAAIILCTASCHEKSGPDANELSEDRKEERKAVDRSESQAASVYCIDPPTMSSISLVIFCWRPLLYSRVSS